MKQIERVPLSWFEKNGIRDYDIIMSNPWKGRQCYVFKGKNGEKLFLKWNDREQSHTPHRLLMEKEENIYQILKQTDITPRYIGGEMFVTEYIDDGLTLRRTIKDLLLKGYDEQAINILQEVFCKWKRFRKEVGLKPKFVEKCEPFYTYNRYLMSLLVSGPIETPKSIFIHYRNRVVLSIFRFHYNRRIIELLQNKEKEIIHGDFHMNNVMIGKGGHAFLLDFENVRTGLAEIELAYMTAQVIHLTEANESFNKRVLQMIDELDLVKDYNIYKRILAIYKKAIAFNPRFC